MFLGYVGAIAGGIGAAAMLLVISKTFRLKMPGWVYPAAAGFGMLFLSIYIEYSWYGEVRSGLPEQIEVVETFEYSVAYQPWTYLIPRVNRFVAIDHATARTNAEVNGLVLIDVLLMERFAPAYVATNFIDCTEGARMLVGEDMQLDDDGRPLDGDWLQVGLDDPLVSATCARHAAAQTG